MTKYREFQAELERLHREAEQSRRRGKRAALDQIRALIIEYEVTPSQLGFTDHAARKTSVVAPKYRDPVTGATWSGRGRAPCWLDGKDRAKFAI